MRYFTLSPETRCLIYRHLVPKGVGPSDIDRYLQLYHKALSDAEAYARRILPFSQRYDGNITLHDAEHSVRVVENINLILDCLSVMGFRPTSKEVEILYISGWCHDIGILLSPHRDHASCSVEIIRSHPEMIDMSVGMSRAVCSVIRSHGHGIDDVSRQSHVDGELIRLRNLCSILCIADLCDYNDYRAPMEVFELIEGKLGYVERLHWMANMGTTITINPKTMAIIVKTDPDVDCSAVTDIFDRYIGMYLEDLGLEPSIKIIRISERIEGSVL